MRVCVIFRWKLKLAGFDWLSMFLLFSWRKIARKCSISVTSFVFVHRWTIINIRQSCYGRHLCLLSKLSYLTLVNAAFFLKRRTFLQSYDSFFIELCSLTTTYCWHFKHCSELACWMVIISTLLDSFSQNSIQIYFKIGHFWSLTPFIGHF